MKYFLLFLLIFKCYAPIESFVLTNIGKSVTGVTKGIAEKIPDVIPSPADLFQYSKNVIAGYPFEVVSLKITK